MSVERPSLIPATETPQQREERIQAYSRTRDAFKLFFKTYSFFKNGDGRLDFPIPASIYDYMFKEYKGPRYYIQSIEFPIVGKAAYKVSRWIDLEKACRYVYGPRGEEEVNEGNDVAEKDFEAYLYTASLKTCISPGARGYTNNYLLDHNGILKKRTVIEHPKSGETFSAKFPGKKGKVKIKGYRTPYSEVGINEARELANFLDPNVGDPAIVFHPRLNTTTEQEVKMGLYRAALRDIKDLNPRERSHIYALHNFDEPFEQYRNSVKKVTNDKIWVIDRKLSLAFGEFIRADMHDGRIDFETGKQLEDWVKEIFVTKVQGPSVIMTGKELQEYPPLNGKDGIRYFFEMGILYAQELILTDKGYSRGEPYEVDEDETNQLRKAVLNSLPIVHRTS